MTDSFLILTPVLVKDPPLFQMAKTLNLSHFHRVRQWVVFEREGSSQNFCVH